MVTKDGYILGVYRIPGKLVETFTTDKPVILLQHGLESDMMFWLYNTGQLAPAFVLAKSGYDVWLGNNRGNRWSDTHINMTNTNKTYWDWSWEEMGTFDTPAVMQYILDTTNTTKLSFIGHSEGTTQILAGGALMNDFYNSKVNVAILLAPTASMLSNSVGLLKLISMPVNRAIITAMIETIELYSILPYDHINTGVATLLCNLFDGNMCDFVLAMFVDTDSTIDDTSRYDMYMSNLPAGVGYKSIIHYGQLMDHQDETFRRYDHGEAGNVAKYG